MADNAEDSLILAALLHDLGHLLHSAGHDATDRGIDPRHEGIGARWLRPRFGDAVADPVAMHVEAKRALAGLDPAYADALSEESKRTLALQGGAFDADQAAVFLERPGAADAIRLRRWDDRAKVPDAVCAGLDHYEPLCARLRRFPKRGAP